MIFMMMGVLAMQAQVSAPVSASPDEKQICKRQPVTGSRTKFVKTCFTAREWQERSRASAKALGEMVDRSAFNNRGPN